MIDYTPVLEGAHPCKECKFAKVSLIWKITSFLFERNLIDPVFYTCVNPDVVRPRLVHTYCRLERDTVGRCGPKGAGWYPKNTKYVFKLLQKEYFTHEPYC